MLDVLPNEIIHLIGEFSCEDSMSSTPSSIENSAVYFYFHTLAYLSLTMYFKTHSQDFWETHPIHIVLRNRDLLEMYGTYSNQQGTSNGSEQQQEEELIEEVTNNTQLLYVHHLIETCEFAHIVIVGERYSMFIHDLLRLLYVKSPQALQNIKTLGITCNVLSLQNDLLPIVLSQCHSLKRLKLNFKVADRVKSDLSKELITEYNQRISTTEHVNIPLKRLSVVPMTEYNQDKVFNFILSLCSHSSTGVSRLNIQGLPSRTLLEGLANSTGSSLKYLSFKRAQHLYWYNGDYNNGSLERKMFENFASKCHKLVSFETNVFGMSIELSSGLIQPTTASTLKTLRLQVLDLTSDNPFDACTFDNLEELVVGKQESHYTYGGHWKLHLMNMCSKGTLKRLTIFKGQNLKELNLNNLVNVEELYLSTLVNNDDYRKLISNCRKLKKLTCLDWNRCDTETLVQILQEADLLTSIHIDAISVEQDALLRVLAQNIRPTLKHISFTAHGSCNSQLTLDELEKLKHIQSLSVGASGTDVQAYFLPNLQELNLSCFVLNPTTFSLLTQTCTQLRKLYVLLKDEINEWNISLPLNHLRTGQFNLRVSQTLVLSLAIYLACPAAYSLPLSIDINDLAYSTYEELEQLDIEPDEYVGFSHFMLKYLPDVLNVLTYLNEVEREQMTSYIKNFVSRDHLENVRHEQHQSGPDYHLTKLFIQFKVQLNEYLDQNKSLSAMFN
jgi:hypothetical protein